MRTGEDAFDSVLLGDSLGDACSKLAEHNATCASVREEGLAESAVDVEAADLAVEAESTAVQEGKARRALEAQVGYKICGINGCLLARMHAGSCVFHPSENEGRCRRRLMSG